MKNIAERNKNVVCDFINAFSNNVQDVYPLLADDVKFVFPYHSGLVAKEISGIEDIRKHLDSVYEQFESRLFHIVYLNVPKAAHRSGFSVSPFQRN